MMLSIEELLDELERVQILTSLLTKANHDLWYEVTLLDPNTFKYMILQSQIYNNEQKIEVLDQYTEKLLSKLLELHP